MPADDDAAQALAAELIAYCKTQLADVKCPRIDRLPRPSSPATRPASSTSGCSRTSTGKTPVEASDGGDHCCAVLARRRRALLCSRSGRTALLELEDRCAHGVPRSRVERMGGRVPRRGHPPTRATRTSITYSARYGRDYYGVVDATVAPALTVNLDDDANNAIDSSRDALGSVATERVITPTTIDGFEARHFTADLSSGNNSATLTGVIVEHDGHVISAIITDGLSNSADGRRAVHRLVRDPLSELATGRRLDQPVMITIRSSVISLTL